MDQKLNFNNFIKGYFINIHMLPLSLYIHIPWCIKKCSYCNFHTLTYNKDINEEQYIFHLLEDLKRDSLLISNRKINTIFIGGGTPSLFSASSIKYLLTNIKKIVSITDNAEITIESNINDLEVKKFLSYQRSGINRFSIGIQSFNSDKLKLLGRTYNYLNILNSIKLLNKIQLKNINFDFIYGLPQQSLKEALYDLKLAIKLNPNHISWYQLTIEPKTYFYSKLPKLPNSEIIWKMFKKGQQLLINSGYQQYEITAYSKKGYKCIHNLNYWKFGDYIGIGCGAHGKITQKNKTIIRTIKNKQLRTFLSGNYLNKITKLSQKDIPLEFFINNLRLKKPIAKKNFLKYTNLNNSVIQTEILKAKNLNYLTENKNYWTITKKGTLFLDNLLEIFIK